MVIEVIAIASKYHQGVGHVDCKIQLINNVVLTSFNKEHRLELDLDYTRLFSNTLRRNKLRTLAHSYT